MAILAAGLVLGIGFALLSGGSSSGSKRVQTIGRTGSISPDKKTGIFSFMKPDGDNSSRRKQIEDTLNRLEDKKKSAKKRQMSLEMRLIQADWSVAPASFMTISVVIGLLIGLAVFIITKKPLFAAGAAFGMGFGAPRWILGMAINKRQKKFTSHFADAMDIIVRGIRTGLPLADCLKIIAHESPEPVSTEFLRVVEAENLGVPIDVCLEQMHDRMPVTEVNFFATVLNIQRQTGGNLGESLENLSGVLRGRKLLAEKIKALSAEARMSAMIIGALPIAVGALVTVLAPDYMADLYGTERGQQNMMIGAVMMVVGIFSMKKMIAFKY
ncbi:MAG: type II secretion system F family protein [Maricaulaceae bacterium]